MTNRSNESGAVPSRSDRFFSQHNYWYFSTREGMDIGPFETLIEANEGVQSFKEFLGETDQATVDRITKYVTEAA